MNKYIFVFLYASSVVFGALPVVEQTPIATIRTPDSYLDDIPETSYIRFAGSRPRYSTCGAVSWAFGTHMLVAVNMQTDSIDTYRFDEDTYELSHVEKKTKRDGIALSRPEGLALTKNHRVFAIPNMKSGILQLYLSKKEELIFGPPSTSIQLSMLHGCNFSPDDRFVSVTSFERGGVIHTYKITTQQKRLSATKVHTLYNPYPALRPKSIAFSPNGKYAVVGYCKQLSDKPHDAEALLAVFRCNQKTGKFAKFPVSETRGLLSTETVQFHPDGRAVYAVDQVLDRVTVHSFNQATGQLGAWRTALQNPEASLSLCHGISIDSSGRFAAVANYGNDSVNIYRIIE